VDHALQQYQLAGREINSLIMFLSRFSFVFLLPLVSIIWSCNKATKSTFIGPAAKFDYTGNPVTGDTVFFIYSSPLQLPAGNKYQWSFGDGGSSTDSFPHHVYADTGTYLVSATVNNNQLSTMWIKLAVFKDPLYTHLLAGVQTWKGVDTDYNYPLINVRAIDTTFSIVYVNAITVSIAGEKYVYVPSMSADRVLYYRCDQSLAGMRGNITFNYSSDSIGCNFSYEYQPQPGPTGGHPPGIQREFTLHSP
jgi:hypothetical protein